MSSDPIKSAHSVFAEHQRRMEARHPVELSREEIFAKAIAEGKNPGAVYLSSLGASKGGKARAAKLTAAQRSAIARKAGKAGGRGRK
jgi:hypothetical protein